MLLIDTNVFLEVELAQEKNESCKKILKKILENEEQGIITDYSVDSICVLMERNGKKSKDIRTFLSGLLAYEGLNIYTTTLNDRIIATDLMEKHGLDFDDALILQAMHSNNIKELVSFDKDFDKIKEIKRIEPK